MADIISVFDYPRTQYTAYWEIVINADTLHWQARVMDWASGQVLKSNDGEFATMEDARLASQKWVLDQMPNYRRALT